MTTSKGRRLAWFTFATLAAAIPAEAAAQAGTQQLERVEITGTSIKRIDAETALPVQVITREQIQKSGATNVEQLLQSVSSVSSSGGLVTATASTATTGGISAISLHGLTPLRTLVLLNGRRIAPYGIGFTNDSVSVDVNSIPLAAIERVEILKDGASAIYGSDAIAGVVNFILRRDLKGVELTGEYGDSTQGGASFKRATGTFGFGDLGNDRYNVMLVASYQKEGALYGRDRAFARSAVTPGAGNDGTSGNTFPANIAALDGSFGTVNPTAASGCQLPYSQRDDFFYDPTQCRFDPSPLVALIPASERTSLFGAARYALTGELTAFAEASYNRNATRTIIQPVPISDQFPLPPNNPLFNLSPYDGTSRIVLSPSSPYYPTAFVRGITGGPTPDLTVRYRAQGAGNRDLTDFAEAPRFVAGVTGTSWGWDVDAAALYSSSRVREQVNGGYPAYSKILPILNSGNVNFFGPSTADVDAALLATNFTGDSYKVSSTLTSIGGKISRDLLRLPAGPLGFALGAEMRREKYDFSANPTIQSGDIAGYGGNLLDVHRSRTVDAAFSEISVPVLAHLDLNAAIRYDHYQGVGNSTTPKVGARWQPIPEVLFRGSFGRGFRAPSLQDLYASNTTSVTPNGQSDPLRCPTTHDGTRDCATQFGIVAGGNPALTPEKSKNLTLGVVVEPVRAVSMGVDYFRVRIDNQISQGLAATTILADPVKYAYLIQRGPVDPAFPSLPGPITSIDQTNLNLGASIVSGFDLDLKWRLPASELGRFTLSATGTYFNRFDTENLDGSFTGGVDVVNTATGGIVPRLKTYISVDWTQGPWNVNLAQNYQKGYDDIFSSTQDPTAPGFQPRHVGSYITYDAQTTYAGFKSMRLTLGVRNLLDRDPPYSNVSGRVNFQGGYDVQYADPRGRFVYARASYQF